MLKNWKVGHFYWDTHHWISYKDSDINIENSRCLVGQGNHYLEQFILYDLRGNSIRCAMNTLVGPEDPNNLNLLDVNRR